MRATAWRSVVVAALLLAAPEGTRADGAAPSLQLGVARMIVLKSGQRLLCVVLEHQPGSHVQVRLLSGRSSMR